MCVLFAGCNSMENTVKMNIEKNANELKLYIFTVQTGGLVMNVPEDCKAIMAYTDDDAFQNVRREYPVWVNLSVRQRAKLSVRKLFDTVNINPVTQDLKAEVEAPVSKEKTIREFVAGMLYIADRFVESPRDKAVLRRIIGKIKLSHEPTP